MAATERGTVNKRELTEQILQEHEHGEITARLVQQTSSPNQKINLMKEAGELAEKLGEENKKLLE